MEVVHLMLEQWRGQLALAMDRAERCQFQLDQMEATEFARVIAERARGKGVKNSPNRPNASIVAENLKLDWDYQAYSGQRRAARDQVAMYSAAITAMCQLLLVLPTATEATD